MTLKEPERNTDMKSTIALILTIALLSGCEKEQVVDVGQIEERDGVADEVNGFPVADSAVIFWNVFRSGDTSTLDTLVQPSTTVHVTLQLPRNDESFIFVGLEEVRGWINQVHPTDKEDGDLIWGNAFQVESKGGRYIDVCNELICQFSGGILHNTLFLSEIEFQVDSEGALLLKKLVILSE
jgi:hypothetical protein